jgi:hypothetical protein
MADRSHPHADEQAETLAETERIREGAVGTLDRLDKRLDALDAAIARLSQVIRANPNRPSWEDLLRDDRGG